MVCGKVGRREESVTTAWNDVAGFVDEGEFSAKGSEVSVRVK